MISKQCLMVGRSPMMYGRRSIWLSAWEERGGNCYAAAQPAIFQQVGVGDAIEKPLLEFDMDAAQQLMDSLWDCGIRPSEGSGSAGALRATQEHLADMKTVAFHALKIKETT